LYQWQYHAIALPTQEKTLAELIMLKNRKTQHLAQIVKNKESLIQFVLTAIFMQENQPPLKRKIIPFYN
jgi:hypothetical protein